MVAEASITLTPQRSAGVGAVPEHSDGVSDYPWHIAVPSVQPLNGLEPT